MVNFPKRKIQASGRIPGCQYFLILKFLFIICLCGCVGILHSGIRNTITFYDDQIILSGKTEAGEVQPALVKMAFIEGGTFIMGSPKDEKQRHNDEVQHQVTVSSFYIGIYELTQEEYELVTGTNPSVIKGLDLPVTNLNWFDAVEFCNMLSEREGFMPVYTITGRGKERIVSWNRAANGYRLPTEAEWEYACRAGTTTPFNLGNNITTDQANYNGDYPYDKNPKGENRDRPMPVGSFEPNPWGLYDMHGNVWEWCWDWYGNYPKEAQIDPTGPSSGRAHVVRGGSFHYRAKSARSANRYINSPMGRGSDCYGIRLVRTYQGE